MPAERSVIMRMPSPPRWHNLVRAALAHLQALMWQDNVDLIAQHVLGTLHSTVQAGGSASAAAAAAGAPKQQRAATAGGAGRGATASAPVLLKRKALALGTQSRGRAAGSGATAEVGGLPGLLLLLCHMPGCELSLLPSLRDADRRMFSVGGVSYQSNSLPMPAGCGSRGGPGSRALRI